jgi:hypothetical protein
MKRFDLRNFYASDDVEELITQRLKVGLRDTWNNVVMSNNGGNKLGTLASQTVVKNASWRFVGIATE